MKFELDSNTAEMKNRLDRFSDLTRDDLNVWTGDEILSRGRSYQKNGRVSELATADIGALVAFVQGTERYDTVVEIDQYGAPFSTCSCPYGVDCRHGVAVVLEYLEGVKEGRSFPEASEEHPLYSLIDEKGLVVERWDGGEWDFDDEDFDDEKFDDEGNWIGAHEESNAAPGGADASTIAFLEGKSKKELIELFRELAALYPEIAQDLADRRRIDSGEITPLVKRLRREIHEVGREPGWQDHWQGEGFTPDYSGIRSTLDVLVKTGHADDVLDVGEELLSVGNRQVEESNDEGQTDMEVSSCIPVLVRALEQSSLAAEERLAWAVNALLQDEYCLFEAFEEYLLQEHDPAAWSALADLLLARLDLVKSGQDESTDRYHRTGLVDWIIQALDHSGRADEIVPICEIEAKETDDYERLVEHLITRQRYKDAERWIHTGIRATEDEWGGGIASRLRDRLIQIRTHQKAWPTLAALLVEEFVRRPSSLTFLSCQKSARKAGAWPKVRERMLVHLESGELPWRQKDWPLPESGLEPPEAALPGSFPMYESLIDVAILEERPEQVLYWYDKRPPQKRIVWYGADENAVANAIQKHAPERAVEIWKDKAEDYIGSVNVGAYRLAAASLSRAAAVMVRENKLKEWDRYLQQLREKHRRKRHLIEILDGLDGTPIVKKKGLRAQPGLPFETPGPTGISLFEDHRPEDNP